MHIKPALIASSENRFKTEDFSPAELDKKLGDGPVAMTLQQKQQRYRQLLAQTNDPGCAQIGLERIINGNDLDSINYLQKGMIASRSVCRIQLMDARSNLVGYATGFLIGPGVMMTNHHVFTRPGDALNSLADFDYELDVNGMDRNPVHFGFEPGRLFYTNDELDFSLVAVAPTSVSGGRALADWGWLALSGQPGKGDPGEYLTIVQHPGGQTKQVCVRENKLLKYAGDFVWYMTDTSAGSSGSPAFNRFWQVIALHHSGVSRKDSKGRTLAKDGRVWDSSMDESAIDWIANEGVRVSSIVADLKTRIGEHPLVKGVLLGQEPPRDSSEKSTSSNGDGAHENGLWIEQSAGGASLVIPVRLPLPLVSRQLQAALTPAGASSPSRKPQFAGDGAGMGNLTQNGLPMEAVHIDQSTLGSRPGYNPNFLGTGKFSVPLPKIPAALKAKVATLANSKESELKYYNYSVVMNKERKLAFFSVVNIDGGKQQDVGKREGDSWLRDPRIGAEFQVGDEFYGRQSSLEADRRRNPFDRGHLVRRLDATWGQSVGEAKEHGDDSFHFTNCTPQFWSYNQGKQLWAGLEDYTREVLLQNQEKGIVMNGPIFDGPDAEGSELPDPAGKPHRDPTFGAISIPKYFWKILITRSNGDLKAAAFIVSQRKLILEIDRIQEPEIFEKLLAEDLKVFQVSMGDLARLTQLDFGNLEQADTHEETSAGPRLIESYDDIRI